MTPQEALYWCEQFENNVVKADPQREKMVLALQAMKECRKALEKQIPKKPAVFDDYSQGRYTVAFCPNCKKILGLLNMAKIDEHCDCGQALDWSDTE